MSTVSKHKRIIGLDTLKLIAIVLIVIYHCFPGLLPGGFLAVDIFFVISGFLIGKKLLRLKEQESIKFGNLKSFLKFTKDRLKRFLPTLIFCMIITLSLAYFANPDLLTNARQNSLFAITFSTNIASIVTESTYENSLIPNLFNQTWFLALELQACIICFLVFSGFFNLFSSTNEKTKHSKIWLFVICFTISLISFTLMGIFGGRYGLYDRAYFGPDSHVGAFFLGTAFAMLTSIKDFKPQQSKRWITWIILVICLIGIISMTPFIHYSSKEAFLIGLPITSILTIILLITILKLQPLKSASIPKYLKPFEYLGSLSFAIYLLHWGLYIILPSLLNSLPLNIIPYLVIVVSIILAILLQKIIYPFSKKHKIIFSILLLLSFIIPILSLIKAPEKSSIETELEENATIANEIELSDSEKNILDYTGLNAFGSLLNSDVLPFFNATENFAKPYPKATTTYIANGGGGGGGRSAYNTPISTASLSSYRVLVIGDSVVLGATQAIYDTVPGVFVDAKGSRNMFDAINILATYRANNNGELPYIIVLGLITNYSAFGADTLATIMDVAGPNHQFIFLTGYCGDYPRDAQNATIRYVANVNKNAHVADWASIAASNPGYYTVADHIHLSWNGRQAYANLISGVVNTL